MYDRTYWKDHVTDQQGRVIQQGTLLDQAHFNNLEKGLSDQSLAAQIMAFKDRQEEYNNEDELKVLTLSMDALPWPFNNKANRKRLQAAS